MRQFPLYDINVKINTTWCAVVIMFYYYVGGGGNKMYFKFTRKNFICLQNAFESVNVVLYILHKAPIIATLSTLLIRLSTTSRYYL